MTDHNQVQESPRAEVQIALVGGQNIPIYIGVLERQPKTIHLFVRINHKPMQRHCRKCLIELNVEFSILTMEKFKTLKGKF